MRCNFRCVQGSSVQLLNVILYALLKRSSGETSCLQLFHTCIFMITSCSACCSSEVFVSTTLEGDVNLFIFRTVESFSSSSGRSSSWRTWLIGGRAVVVIVWVSILVTCFGAIETIAARSLFFFSLTFCNTNHIPKMFRKNEPLDK